MVFTCKKSFLTIHTCCLYDDLYHDFFTIYITHYLITFMLLHQRNGMDKLM